MMVMTMMMKMMLMNHTSIQTWYSKIKNGLNFPFKLPLTTSLNCYTPIFLQAKAMKEKESKTDDWKQKMTKGVKDIGETLKRHAYKISNRMRQWWKRVKAERTNKNLNTGKLEL